MSWKRCAGVWRAISAVRSRGRGRCSAPRSAKRLAARGMDGRIDTRWRQYLLDRARWDAQGARDVLRQYAVEQLGTRDQVLDEFDAFLEAVRGLTTDTRRKYGRFVKLFLYEWISGAPLEWQHLSPDALRAYARRDLLSTVRWPSNTPFVALRAMLRFLAVKGLVAPGLEGAVPRIRRWCHAAPPACPPACRSMRLTCDLIRRQRHYAAASAQYGDRSPAREDRNASRGGDQAHA
ncbi:hypothetical protein LMG29542_08044 [Paraburkholderia humisilvae]|uniref:Core-binding (CB) domain-containing protein n=1 Tax=Paraburkholderia humisilvae TaxID=627669 RepID=A0A6J5FBN1_9BURK|nr:hypothetical protein LMG29542_08044 [Paraburkholderia humisilvae]